MFTCILVFPCKKKGKKKKKNILKIYFAGVPVVFDSLKGRITSETETQIAMMLKTNDSSIHYIHPDVPQQMNNVDCALFAIAYAFEFVLRRKLMRIDFDVTKLRDHWSDCLIKGEVLPFPRHSEQEIDVTNEIFETAEVYCTCRLPEHYSKKMVACGACEQWFHRVCIQDQQLPDSWICQGCAKKG